MAVEHVNVIVDLGSNVHKSNGVKTHHANVWQHNKSFNIDHSKHSSNCTYAFT
jgi:hypothetical protein